jgi:DNA-binding CsgD family transcriptional regulator
LKSSCSQTKREQIRTLRAQGKKPKETAEALDISVQQVYNEISRIKKEDKVQQAVSSAAIAEGDKHGEDTSNQRIEVKLAGKERKSGRQQEDDESRKRRSTAFALFREGMKNDLEVAMELNLSEAELADYKRQYLIIVGRQAMVKLYEREPKRVEALFKLEEMMEKEKMTPSICVEAMKNRRLGDFTNRRIEEASQTLEIKQKEIALAESRLEQIAKHCNEQEDLLSQAEKKLNDLEEQIHLKRSAEREANQAAAEAHKQSEEAKISLEGMKHLSSLQDQEFQNRIKELLGNSEIESQLLEGLHEFFGNPYVKELVEHSQLSKPLDSISQENKQDASWARYMFADYLLDCLKQVLKTSLHSKTACITK